tara:strand:+ start:4851 stop:5099 length:249 start_codon:yes stop_codon:yes gene_type:complete
MSEEESEGLGDTVEKIITKIGDVTKIEWIRKKKGCSGCRKRQRMLNNAFPYKKKEEKSEGGCPDCDKKKKKGGGGCKGCGNK